MSASFEMKVDEGIRFLPCKLCAAALALLNGAFCRGLDLTVKRWEHSAHCAHLRKHPVEYVAALKTFLSKVSK